MVAKFLPLTLLAFAKLGFAANEYSDDDWANSMFTKLDNSTIK